MATGTIKKGIVTQQFIFAGQSVTAGSYVDVNIDVSKSGYKAIGIGHWVINGTTRCALLYAAFTTATNLRLRIVNTSDSSAQSFAESAVTVLYE